MNKNLLLAILSMDSYNRGYQPVMQMGRDARLGNAEINYVNLPAGAFHSGFYAQRYNIADYGYDGGSNVIAYRGTDYPNSVVTSQKFRDIWSGWTIGAGYSGAHQAAQALEFYNDAGGDFNTILTGHSLGGGLAGFVSALYGNQAVLFDHMPFGIAAALQAYYQNGSDAALQALSHSLTAFHVDGEVLEAVRSGTVQAALAPLAPWLASLSQDAISPALAGALAAGVAAITSAHEAGINNTGLSQFGADLPGFDPVAAHSIALLVILMFGETEWQGGTAWQSAADLVLPLIFDEALAEELGFERATQQSGVEESGTAGSQLAHAIAYSALDEGELPFGFVAIRSLFDDMTDLGVALSSGRSWSSFPDQFEENLAKYLMRFSGVATSIYGGNDTASEYLTSKKMGVLDATTSSISILTDTGAFGSGIINIAGGDFVKEDNSLIIHIIDDYLEELGFLQTSVARNYLSSWTLSSNFHAATPGLYEALYAKFNATQLAGASAVGAVTVSADGISSFDANDLAMEHGISAIFGNSSANDIKGSVDDEVILGGDGDDSISGGLGSNILIGGLGVDTIDRTDDGVSITVQIGQPSGAAGTGPLFGDSVSYAGVFDPVSGITVAGAADTVFQFERLMTGAGADTLVVNTWEITSNLWEYIDLGSNPYGDTVHGDAIDLRELEVGVIVDLSTASSQYAHSTASVDHYVSLKNVENVFGTKYNDTISARDDGFGSPGSYILAGAGNDTIYSSDSLSLIYAGDGDDVIHVGAGNFVVGGKGADTFYLTSSVNGVSLGLNNVFLLDFDPNEDTLIVDGKTMTYGFNKEVRWERITEPNAEFYPFQAAAVSGTSPWAQDGTLRPLQPTETLIPLEQMLMPGQPPAYQSGAYEDVTVNAVTYGDFSFGRMQFARSTYLSFGEMVPVEEAGAQGIVVTSGLNLTNLLNLYIGMDAASSSQFFKTTSFGEAFISKTNLYTPAPHQYIGQLDLGTIAHGFFNNSTSTEQTGFTAESLFLDSIDWGSSFGHSVRVLRNTDTIPGSGSASRSLSSTKFAAHQLAPWELADDQPISFVYREALTIELLTPRAMFRSSEMQSLFESYDIDAVSSLRFNEAMGMEEFGVIPEGARITPGSFNGGSAMFGTSEDETLYATYGSDFLVGGAGNDEFMSLEAGGQDWLSGGDGDDTYFVGGMFDKVIISEKFRSTSISGGVDILNIDAPSDSVVVIAGNDGLGIRLIITQDENIGIITLAGQLSSDSTDWIEEIHFSDNVVWDRDDVLAALGTIEALSGGQELEIQVDEENFWVEFSAGDAFADLLRRRADYTVTLINGDPLPDWLGVVAGVVTGQPPAGFSGEIELKIVASAGGETAISTAVIVVNSLNDAPTVRLIPEDIAVRAGDNLNLQINNGIFSDSNGDSVQLTAQLEGGDPLPSWLSFDGTYLTGTAPSGINDTLVIEIIGSDGELTANVSFEMHLLAAFNDVTGTSGNDVVSGTGTDDALYGLDGDDFINPGAGADYVHGGNHSTGDRVSYQSASGAVGVSLLYGGFFGDAEGDVYVDIEDIAGSSFDDILEGNNEANLIFGGSGSDVLAGLDGNDNLRGDAGADYIYGGDGDDVISSDRSDNAADFIYGEAGNDFLVGGNGDTLSGGDGDDQLDIRGNSVVLMGDAGADTFNMIADSATSLKLDGGDGWDYLSLPIGRDISVTSITGIEWFYADNDPSDISTITAQLATLDLAEGSFTGRLDIVAGSISGTTIVGPSSSRFSYSSDQLRIFGNVGDDDLTGSSHADKIYGGDGEDILRGLGGNDIFEGGNGDDQFEGGGGTDQVRLSGNSGGYALVTSGGHLYIEDTAPSTDGDDGNDRLVGIEQLVFKNDETVNISSPIILDLDGNGVTTLSASASHARYDMNGDGIRDDTSWMGAGEGLLFLDRDGNGALSNANEFSFVNDVDGAASDLAGLRAFDSNGDGILSSLDSRYGDFRIWSDGDGDGVTDSGEIMGLAAAGVQSINLAGSAVSGVTALGDVAVINTGSYLRADGVEMQFIDAALTYFADSHTSASNNFRAGIHGRRFFELMQNETLQEHLQDRFNLNSRPGLRGGRLWSSQFSLLANSDVDQDGANATGNLVSGDNGAQTYRHTNFGEAVLSAPIADAFVSEPSEELEATFAGGKFGGSGVAWHIEGMPRPLEWFV